MNRIFLGISCLGALAVIVFAAISDGDKETAATAQLTKFAPVSFAADQDRGSMTTEASVDLATGETEETRVIAFLD